MWGALKIWCSEFEAYLVLKMAFVPAADVMSKQAPETNLINDLKMFQLL